MYDIPQAREAGCHWSVNHLSFAKSWVCFLQYVKCFELGLIGACFALQGLFFLRVVSSKGKWRVEQGEEAVAAVAVEIRPEDPGMCRRKSRLPQEEEEDREVLRQRKQLKLRLLFHRDHL